MKLLNFFGFLFLLSLYSCSTSPNEKIPESNVSAQLVANSAATTASFFPSKKGLDKYWFQGKGEINVYELAQNRYNAVHPGEAILVFVTEDFLTEQQVKNDHYTNPNSTLALKTNFLRRFTTGIYDYSLMTSVFTPANANNTFPHTLKVSTSVQDWCGQVFSQLNLKDGAYQEQLHSYFESEGERKEAADLAILEDELFNRIRMDWEALPQGKQAIIPSSTYLRLRHRPFGVYEAEFTLSDYQGDDFTGEGLKIYTVNFASENRILEIVFQQAPPYLIEGWVDAYPSAFDQKTRKTVAKRKTTTLEAYWSLNKRSDQSKRAAIGLE